MKKAIASILVSMAVLCLQADNSPSTTEENKPLSEFRGSMRVFGGVEFKNRTWYTDAMRHYQDFLSANIGIEHQKTSDVFWKLQLSHGSGKTNRRWYDHETQAEVQLGYTFCLHPSACATITPFIGLGQLYIYETIYNSDPLKIHYGYVPLGVILGWKVSDTWSFALRTQADISFDSSFKVANQKGWITKKTNWKIELPVTYNVDQTWDIQLTPSFSINPNRTCYDPIEDELFAFGQIYSHGVRVEVGYKL